MATTASGVPAAIAAHAKERREIMTPEGVPLHVFLAARSDRAVALFIDLIIMIAAIVVIGLVAALGFGFDDAFASGWIWSLVLLAWFLIRSFYFVYFELRWQGSTPGKRAMGLRVIDRQGGQLRTEAVFARNLMREIEVFIPISALLMAQVSGTWASLLTVIWAAVFMLMPCFNKDRLRVGDIVAGTWVVWAPKGILLSDLAGQSPVAATAPLSLYQFTASQLAIYGIFELQTLETVLRKSGPDSNETRAAVCERIRRKIGWTPAAGQSVEPKAFLEAFYAALRAHLETRMLFGVRRENKHDSGDKRRT